MGSSALERSGRRVVLYDARGHGGSGPAPGGDYSFAAQAADLEAVIGTLDGGPAVLIGASMGAHTALALALQAPALVAGLVLVTPSYDPERPHGDLEHWDSLAQPARERVPVLEVAVRTLRVIGRGDEHEAGDERRRLERQRERGVRAHRGADQHGGTAVKRSDHGLQVGGLRGEGVVAAGGGPGAAVAARVVEHHAAPRALERTRSHQHVAPRRREAVQADDNRALALLLALEDLPVAPQWKAHRPD